MAGFLAVVLLGPVGAAGQKADNELPERFRAFAANLGNVRTNLDGRPLEIQISRWSTQGEEQKMLEGLKEKGPRELMNILQDLPKVGWIRTQGSLSYDLRFARYAPAGDGGRQVTLITDRPMQFWEMAGGSISRDYPFTVIELTLNHEGKGEGKLMMATKITIQAGILVLEDLSTQPIRLMSVTKEK